MALFLIYTIFIVAFFGNLFVQYNIIPAEITLVTEISVYLLFCYSLTVRGAKKSLDLWYVYSAFILVALCSAFLNHYLNISLIIALRPVLRFYIFYLALINLHLSDKHLKNVNNLIIALFIVQLPASAIRFSYLGISEHTIGTWGEYGGGITTIIPIVALGYLGGFYVFWKPKLIYMFTGVCFVMFGIAGAKRALFFLFPIAFVGIYYLGYIKGKKVSSFKHLGIAIIIIAAIITIQIIMMKGNDTLNPERQVGGSVNYDYVINYAQKYEAQTGTTPVSGSAGGRFSTTALAFKIVLNAGIGEIFFGFGPGSVGKSQIEINRVRDRRIYPFIASYGKTGMSHTLVECGLLGLIAFGFVFLIFMNRSLTWFKLETDPYWKSIAMGNVVFTFLFTFIFFFYNRAPVFDDTVVPVYFYAMSTMYYRLNAISESRRLTITKDGRC